MGKKTKRNHKKAPVPVPVPVNSLLELAFCGDEARVAGLIARGADVNQATGAEGVSPLYFASQEGHCDVVQILISANADVNQAMKNGGSPLFVASQNGHCGVIQLLLSASAGLNQATTDNGASPLYIASQEGHCDVMQILISAGADVNAVSNVGASVLMAAAYYGHKPVVKLLLEHRACTNTRNPQYDSFTALHFAAMGGHRSIANVLAPITELEDGELAELSGEGMSSELRAKLKLRQCAGCERLQLLGEAKFKRCAGCGSVAYCARACQVRTWKEHKVECRKGAVDASS